MRLSDLTLWILLLALGGGVCWAVLKSVVSLRSAPREFWLLLLFCSISIVASKAMLLTLMLWLCRDCHQSDFGAGWLGAGYSAIALLLGLGVGRWCEQVGLLRSLGTACLALAFGGLLLSRISNPWLILGAGFAPLALGFGIVNVISQLGIKTFVPHEHLSVAFSLFCILYNVSVALGGWVFDLSRVCFSRRDERGAIVDEAAGLSILGLHFSSYQLIFVFCAGVAIVGAFLLWPMRAAHDALHDGRGIESPHKLTHPPCHALAVLIGMLVSMTFVLSMFMHCEVTLPVYSLRIFGEGTRCAAICCIMNCVLMITLVPLVGVLARRVSSWAMLIVGSAVCSLSLLFILVPSGAWVCLNHSWLGDWILIKWFGLAGATAQLTEWDARYWGFIMMTLFLSIGEALWAPRLPQLCLELAPKGSGALFLSLGSLPLFAARLLVCTHSGAMLHHYTGVGVSRNPAWLWLWISLLGLMAPLGLLITWAIMVRRQRVAHGRSPVVSSAFPLHDPT